MLRSLGDEHGSLADLRSDQTPSLFNANSSHSSAFPDLAGSAERATLGGPFPGPGRPLDDVYLPPLQGGGPNASS